MKCQFLDIDQTVPTSMPLLDQWVDGHRSEQPLANKTALFIQHQFGNQVPMTRALLDLGLAPERLFWLDVPYTSNPLVRDVLIGFGIPPENFTVSDDYRMLTPYAPYQRARVQTLIRKFLDNKPSSLLVLDDGAYFLEAASCFKDQIPGVAIVEQTSRGTIKMEESAVMRKYAHSVPIVDVARSAPKKTLEPPFIGMAVCTALVRQLGRGYSAGPSGRCLILGYGAIGTQVARFVVETLNFERRSVHVFDTNSLRVAAASQDGYSLWDREDFDTHFQLVIGCSGRASFGVHDYVYLDDGAVLASASSGSVELSREDFIELADSSDIDDIEILREELDENNIHQSLRFRLVDREAVFLNGGFPVNFVGDVNCVPTQYMQPTAAMMVAAAVQAVSASRTYLLDLDQEFCEWIIRRFTEEMGEEALEINLPRLSSQRAGG